MICVSTDCPLYTACQKTVPQYTMDICIPFAYCASGRADQEKTEIDWWCGPLGNYMLFEEKK